MPMEPLADLSYESTALARRACVGLPPLRHRVAHPRLIVFRFDTTTCGGDRLPGRRDLHRGRVHELAIMAFVSGAWKWLHGILAGVFVVVGILSFVRPVDTFVGLSAVVAFFFLFAGIFDILEALLSRDLEPLVAPPHRRDRRARLRLLGGRQLSALARSSSARSSAWPRCSRGRDGQHARGLQPRSLDPQRARAPLEGAAPAAAARLGSVDEVARRDRLSARGRVGALPSQHPPEGLPGDARAAASRPPGAR